MLGLIDTEEDLKYRKKYASLRRDEKNARIAKFVLKFTKSCYDVIRKSKDKPSFSIAGSERIKGLETTKRIRNGMDSLCLFLEKVRQTKICTTQAITWSERRIYESTSLSKMWKAQLGKCIQLH
jgi:hypothetical protein